MTWIVSTAILLCSLAVAALAFTATEGLDRESRIISDEMESFRLYGESLQEKNRALRRYRHDANALMQAIEYALAHDVRADGQAGEGSASGNQGATGALRGEGREEPVHVELALVDAIVDLKRGQCAQAHIAFTAALSPVVTAALKQAGIPEGDVAAIVQNLLENAYEASLRLDESADPFVDVSIEGPVDGSVSICVSNRVDSAQAPAFRTRKPNPEQHGLGMRIVKDIARSHGGSCTTSFDAATRVLAVSVKLATR